ncbi:MAG: FAD-dependent monooxygenase [Xanthobacteraceae bacterium]|nr:FAD-dependent monooxygenase [Xanthobacteraceae bacterium]
MNKQTPDKPLDVAIAGAGIVGAALGVALKQTLGNGFAVAVFDPSLTKEPARDDRTVAIAGGARRLFEAIGVWERLTDVQPIRAMEITDSKLHDAVRQTFLEFSEHDEDEPFAHMVENRALMAALREALEEAEIELVSSGIGAYSADESFAQFEADGKKYRTRLLAAADGAQSKLRTLAKIQTISRGYDQSGIVATLGHARDHNGKAVQHFLPSGSFAILPLTGKRSSIVWTEQSAEAKRIVALPPAEFLAELELRFGLQLGELEVLSPARAYPLQISIARSFIAERLALVGDAAHVIHPLAGQGLNMGLRDVAALAECIADNARLGLDPGAPEALTRYQRWRRADTMAMGLATDGLNRLFSNESIALKYLRDLGLGLVDRAPALKKFFAREAAGLTGDVPKLLRGEYI